MNNLEQGNLYQLGGAYLNDTDAFVPPTGKVIAYIEVVAANTTFDTLTPANDAGSNTYHLGTTVASISNSSNNLTVEGNGANAVAISAENWDKGQKFYGRWSAVTLTDGAIIMYFAQA